MGDNTRTINKHANTSYSIGNRNTDYTYCGYYLVSLQYILKASYIRLDLCTKQGFFCYLQKKTSPRCALNTRLGPRRQSPWTGMGRHLKSARQGITKVEGMPA